jgi:hypothetical protein
MKVYKIIPCKTKCYPNTSYAIAIAKWKDSKKSKQNECVIAIENASQFAKLMACSVFPLIKSSFYNCQEITLL